MAGSDEKTFEYDVFISHSSKDKPVVRQLAERLRGDGLRVWLDEWIIQPGDSIPLAIENGLEQSRTLILCMSANSFASEWVTLERHMVMFRDPTNLQRRFIPLRLDGAVIKDNLKQFAYVDWQHQDI
jgi:TIR domain